MILVNSLRHEQSNPMDEMESIFSAVYVITIMMFAVYLYKVQVLVIIRHTKLMANNIFAIVEVSSSICHVNQPIQIRYV